MAAGILLGLVCHHGDADPQLFDEPFSRGSPLVDHFQATSLNGPMIQTLTALGQSEMDHSIYSALLPRALPPTPLSNPSQRLTGGKGKQSPDQSNTFTLKFSDHNSCRSQRAL